jgi:hypothetical protein
MNVRRTILLAAGVLLALPASAQGTASQSQQQPPSDQSQNWYQKDAQKARSLGQQGAGAVQKGATSAGKKLNEGGQAATAKVVGTKTIAGQIAEVSQDRMTLKKSDGTPMNLRVTNSTKVTVDGQKGSVESLRQGDEVRASYAQSGGSATAMKIDVKRTRGSGSSSTGSPSDTGSGSGPTSK